MIDEGITSLRREALLKQAVSVIGNPRRVVRQPDDRIVGNLPQHMLQPECGVRGFFLGHSAQGIDSSLWRRCASGLPIRSPKTWPHTQKRMPSQPGQRQRAPPILPMSAAPRTAPVARRSALRPHALHPIESCRISKPLSKPLGFHGCRSLMTPGQHQIGTTVQP